MSDADAGDSDQESLARRLFLFAVGGALGGFVTAPLFLAPEFAVRGLDQGRSLLEFLDFYSPLGDPFWVVVTSHVEVFASGPFAGVLFGVLAGVFARGRRNGIQALKIALSYGSIYGSVAMASVLANQDFNIKGLVLVLVFFVVGFVLGGATGFFTGIADRVLRRYFPQSAVDTTQESD